MGLGAGGRGAQGCGVGSQGGFYLPRRQERVLACLPVLAAGDVSGRADRADSGLQKCAPRRKLCALRGLLKAKVPENGFTPKLKTLTLLPPQGHVHAYIYMRFPESMYVSDPQNQALPLGDSTPGFSLVAPLTV